jgi:hypothetical protein
VLLGQTEEAHAAAEGEPASGISNAAAGTLATELQRSLDYYRREYPQATSVGRTNLATHDPEVEPQAEWLSPARRLDVVVAEPPIAMGVSRAIAAQLEAPEGLRFLGAAGLAMHEMPGSSAVPSFDLSAQDRVPPDVRIARRSLTISMAISIVLVLVGIVAALTLGRNVQVLEHQLDLKKAELGRSQIENRARVAYLQAQEDMLRTLKLEGFPFPRLMDAIAAAVDTEAGLTEVGLEPYGKLRVGGDASNARSIIRTLEGLKACPYFENTSLDSFEWAVTGQTRVLKFQVSSQLVGMRPPQPASASMTP